MDRSPAPAGAHQGGPAGAAAHEAHPSRAGLYFLIFVVLFVVTGVEVGVTYFPQIPQAPTLIALAVVKFFLIAAFFMHLKYDSRVFSALFILGLIIAAGMLFSFLALFTAHYREPFTATEPTSSATVTAVAGGTATSPAPGAGR
jgi:cytochrome c oxidase subunit 4